MHSPALLNKLRSHVPQAAGDQAVNLLMECRCEMVFSASRRSKLGDFKRRKGRKQPIISVNADLEPRIFLLTFVHELAHAQVYDQYRLKRIAPHGKEWKHTYRKLLQPFLTVSIFGDAIKCAVFHWEKAPAAWSKSDPLHHLLPQNDFPEFTLKLSELVLPTTFVTPGGRKFQSIEKRRVRFLCRDLENGKQYLVHGETPVKQIA